MSYSSLYLVYRTKSKRLGEFGNSWGNGAALWSYICAKYLHKEDSWWLLNHPCQELWDLVNPGNTTLPIHLRMAHKWIMDGAVCPCDKAKRMAEYLHLVYDDIYQRKPNHANNWKAIGDALLSAHGSKRALGYGLSCTSVSDPWIDWGRDTQRPHNLWDIFTDEYLTPVQEAGEVLFAEAKKRYGGKPIGPISIDEHIAASEAGEVQGE